MRVLHIYHIFPAIYGGVSYVVYNLAKELSKRQYDVHILTTNAYFNTTCDSDSSGKIKVHRFKVISQKLAKRKLIIPSSSFFMWLEKNVTSFNLVHVHGFRNVYTPLVYLVLKEMKVPYVLQVHGSLPRVTRGRKLKWIYDISLGYKLLRDASKVIALSYLEAKQYKAIGVPEEKIAIIPNGIDLSEYTQLPHKGNFKKKFNIPEKKKIILYLGRIDRTKGIDLLIRACAYLKNEMNFKDAVLVIAGPDDGYLNKVKALARSLRVYNSIVFTGFISSEDKLRALVDADVFVTPSFYGFPITFLEACATGTPIVTTSLGDTLEWMDGKVGYVTQPTHHCLADAIYRIVSDDKLHRKFSRNCINIVRSGFSLEKVVERLEKIYKEVVEG